MPNKKSAIKRARQSERRRLRNRDARSSMRTSVKKAIKTIDAKEVEAIPTAVQTAQAKLGKAAKRNLIKKNTMSRIQSRLMKRAARAKAQQAEA